MFMASCIGSLSGTTSILHSNKSLRNQNMYTFCLVCYDAIFEKNTLSLIIHKKSMSHKLRFQLLCFEFALFKMIKSKFQ